LEGRLLDSDDWVLIDEQILTDIPQIGEQLTFDVFDIKTIINDDGTTQEIKNPFICSQVRLTIIDNPIYEPTENDNWDNMHRLCCY
jgi:hypothetical protein